MTLNFKLSEPARAIQSTTACEIRPARWGDKEALLEMIRALAEFNGDTPEIDILSLIDLMSADAPWLKLIVAERDGVLVGYAGLVPGVRLQHGMKVLDLHHLYVRDDARGLGIGRALIEESKVIAAEMGCKRLTVSTHHENTAAQKTYLACGFEALPARGKTFAMEIG
ncbi:GNAT family N-acetyltransferase [Celeribacter litoreus]|uniref:GNAT family N-acetyltransferase n=1 Tax=Celeribacter litoreus TaxID=2876714 RepID=UPI001CCC095F|nr:GNAT family N-acetyltransferase [Celeribacter litoreus]MCA0043726.1 GNAT family N-acetyltransferase [Celeribacter litoreus]